MILFDRDSWQEIWATITRNRTRSVLTAFGVSWGIFMLVVLIGAGNSFKGGVMGTLSGFTTNSCFVVPRLTTEPYKGYRKNRSWRLDNRDLELIATGVRSVEFISPILNRSSDVTRGNKRGNFSMMGILPVNYRIESHIPIQGRLISDADNQELRKVCVIGEEVYKTLFDIGEQAVGKFIRIGNIYYKVIGVERPEAENVSIGGNPKNAIYLPFAIMQRTFNYGDEFDFLGCVSLPGIRTSAAMQDIVDLLKRTHEIAPTDDKAFFTLDAEEQFEMFTNFFTGVDVLIWIVGLGALFSGIIGISNIMLVTVRERMREIGIRRALGARPSMILGQVLSETLVLTTLAGVAGMVAGIWLLNAVGFGMSMAPAEGGSILTAPTLPFATALAALAVLIVSGVLAGIIPAMMAMRIKAIDAIRDE